VITSFGDEGRTNLTLRSALACSVWFRLRVERSIFLVPVSVGVEVAAGVEESVGDGVVADFFAVAVAKDENRGRQGLRRLAVAMRMAGRESVESDELLDGFAA
jgi:hypothetical protein